MKKGYSRIVKRILHIILLRDRPLMLKLLVYSALLVVLPLLLVGLLSYNQSSEVLEREAKHYSLQILEQVKHYVEDYFRDFEISTLKILNHPDTVAFLRMHSMEPESRRDVVKAAKNVLKNSAYSRSDVTNITILLEDMQIIDSADVANVISAYDILEEDWMNAVPVNGEPLIISRVIAWKGREEPVISIIKRIVNPNTLTPFGLLIIDVNHKRMHDVARKVKPGNTGFMYVTDDQGHYVYHPQAEFVGRKAEPTIVAAIEANSGESMNAGNGNKQLHIFSRSDKLGWQFATAIPHKELMQGTSYIGKTILLTTLLFMLIAYVLALGFVTSLVRPIKRLHLYMKRVEIGDFSGKVEVESRDEIGLLSHSFNKMVEQLAKLVQEVYYSKLRQTELNLRQKETELLMLQNQINPHFLYNSLDTIRGMALHQDMNDIADMAAALARLLRYNVKEGGVKVTVRQELEVARTYLRIQKFRFGDKLDYTFDVPDELMDLLMNKFILQPLIENCIVHGLEPQTGNLNINLSGVKDEEGTFLLTVSDTGPGISNAKLKELQTELLKEKTEENGQHTHIGLMNVHRRIQFAFGPAYGLSIHCGTGGGTAVHIRLPCPSCTHTQREGGI